MERVIVFAILTDRSLLMSSGAGGVYRYVEWENAPERKRIASQLLKTKKFTPIPGQCLFFKRFSHIFLTDIQLEFQFVPLPQTNPILVGHRWKEYHEALGLKSIVDYSWEMVLKEKHDMLHVLDFPYNGETRPQYLLGDGKITQNRHHLYVCASVELRFVP